MSVFMKHMTNPISRAGVNLFLFFIILFSAGCVPQVSDANSGDPQSQTSSNIQSGSVDDAGTGASSPSETSMVPGLPASPTMTVTETPRSGVSLSFVPDADAYVSQSEPTVNYGGKKSLKVDSGTNSNESFIRFTILQIPGVIQNAQLRLYTTSNASKDGPAIYTTSGSWSEEDITWNNRPKPDGDALDNKGQLDANTWVDYDVTSSVTGQGSFSFILSADSGDAIAFSSLDGDYPPELVVTFIPDVTAVPASTGTDEDVTLVGAGDISMCSNDNDEMTAKLLDDIPGTVFTTGDDAYPNGTVGNFKECFDSTWGRHKDRTKPTPGNHDYRTQDGGPYYEYFNDVPPYYAYNLGSWRIYALNSEIDVSENSPQTQWLKLDLALNPNRCVLAYWHQPRWSSGSTHGNSLRMRVFWKILSDAGAELVLNGHEHNYERFMPMDADGNADPQGLREIVIGTGGGELYPFGSPLPTTEIRNNTTFGVLKLTLHADSYDWQFVPVEGSTFTDSGNTNCH